MVEVIAQFKMDLQTRPESTVVAFIDDNPI